MVRIVRTGLAFLVAMATATAVASGADAPAVVDRPDLTERLVVTFAEGTNPAERRAIAVQSGAVPGRDLPPISTLLVRAPGGAVGPVSRALRAHHRVERVEADALASVSDDPTSSTVDPPSVLNDVLGIGTSVATLLPLPLGRDLLFGQQWGLQAIRAETAWTRTKASDQQVVAVVDSGVDYNHLDLAGKVIRGHDWVSDDEDPMDPLLTFSHGTHVAGIVAAKTDNLIGVAGTAPNARVLAIRVLDTDGRGYYSDIASGIVEAADAGADVINLSLGGPSPSTALRDALGYAVAKGTFVTCATGNDAAAAISWPATYDECFAVGATTITDERAPFSNAGAGIDLSAPGVGILSTVPTQLYASADGTSMATPFVSGVAALLSSQGLTAPQVRDRLVRTATDLGPAGLDTWFGWGRLDAAAAVGAAAPASPPPVPPSGSGPVAPVEPGSGQADPPGGRPATVRVAIRQVTARGTRRACGGTVARGCRYRAGDRIRIRGAVTSTRSYAGRRVTITVRRMVRGKWTGASTQRISAGPGGAFALDLRGRIGRFQLVATTPASKVHRPGRSAQQVLLVSRR